MNDAVGDALIRIKNGYSVGKMTVSLRYSKLVWNIMKLLQKEGFVSEVSQKGHEIVVSLKYNLRAAAITDLKRVSKPSLRVYKGAKELPVVLNGLGVAIISTPKGLMTNKEAYKAKIGGEVLALVW